MSGISLALICVFMVSSQRAVRLRKRVAFIPPVWFNQSVIELTILPGEVYYALLVSLEKEPFPETLSRFFGSDISRSDVFAGLWRPV